MAYVIVRWVILDGLLGNRIKNSPKRVLNLYEPHLFFLLSELILVPAQLLTRFYGD